MITLTLPSGEEIYLEPEDIKGIEESADGTGSVITFRTPMDDILSEDWELTDN